MKNIYLIRHCKAEGQSADAPLTELGREQAHKLTEFLLPKNIDLIISSPYERASRTIKPLAEKLSMEIIIDVRLKERVLSNKNHKDWREMLRKTFDDLDLCYVGGESSNEAITRSINVIREVLNKEYTSAAIVSHGNLISLLLKYFDDKRGFEEWEVMSNPDVYQLSFIHDTPIIERIWTDC